MEAYIPKNSCYRIFCLLLLVFTTLGVKAQILAEPDCPDAYTICDASQSYYFEVNGSGAIDDAYGEMSLSCQANTSADQFESSSAWFTFTPKFSGEFGFYILPDINEDWEFILFENTPDCTDLNNTSYHLICNSFSPESPTNSYTGAGVHPTIGGPPGTVQGFEDYVTVNEGETYVLFITPIVADGGFNHRATLTFQGGLIETHVADAFEQVPACTLSVDEFSFDDDVQVYPNPVTNILNIKANNILRSVKVHNLLGQQLLSFTPNSLKKEIDLSYFNAGIYLVTVGVGEQTKTYKVLKY